jgi:hypothetical protein
MKTRPPARLYALVAIALGLVLPAGPAQAQFQPRPLNDPPTGERYHIEGAAGLWFPGADMSISSQSLGIIGSTIDFAKDLGQQDQHFPEVHLELRPATRHKFRFQYIPINYEQTATVTRDLIFNGQRYRTGVAVKSTLDWKAYRAGYEYDFIETNRWFAGFMLDFKYTDVTATLCCHPVDPTSTSSVVTEFAHAQAPIPALGGVFRIYPVPNISITGEVTGFKLPDKLVKDTTGHYLDVDVYGTLNFTDKLGVQLGYRRFDVGYIVKTDTGSFVLNGLFFGVVARY